MVYGDRRYWRYIFVPWMWSTLIFVAVVTVGYFALVPYVQGQIDSAIGPNSSGASFLHGLVALAYAVIWFFIAGFVFLTITAITSSFLWEELSRKVEESITDAPAPKSTLSNARIAIDSLSRGMRRPVRQRFEGAL